MKRLLREVRSHVAPFAQVMSWRDHRRLLALPPLTEGETTLLNMPVAFSDRIGFLHSVEEIFLEEVYRFRSGSAHPVIIDAGANIGLSVLYFKCLHPDCTITAFEPDPAIFRLLEQNLLRWGFGGVELRNAAAWVADEALTFYLEGSLAGSAMADFTGKGRQVTVKAERLKPLLQEREVDFLKVDIEGAENRVLFDIAPELAQVRTLFFEYHSLAGQSQQLDELLRLVSEAGFRYVIKGAAAPRHPFVDAPLSPFDMQLNVFCRRD